MLNFRISNQCPLPVPFVSSLCLSLFLSLLPVPIAAPFACPYSFPLFLSPFSASVSAFVPALLPITYVSFQYKFPCQTFVLWDGRRGRGHNSLGSLRGIYNTSLYQFEEQNDIRIDNWKMSTSSVS